MPAHRLRIAMISVHSCPVGMLGTRDTGGMSVYIRELARELGKQGHCIDIYTRVHDPDDSQIIDLGPNARLIHLAVGGSDELNKLALYPYLPEFAANLEDFRNSHDRRYDMVFSHYWLSGIVGQQLQQWWGVPHLTMFHTLGAVKNAIGIGETEPELRIDIERQLVRSCQRIIAPTEKEKENLIGYYGASPETIGVVPCGVDMKRFRPMGKKPARQRLGFTDDTILLYVGRIEPLKGIDRLIRAVAFLPQNRKPRLVIIGGDESSQPEIQILRKLSAELGIAGAVTFVGLVKHEQLPGYYSLADICVVPSYYESFGLVALESLACGTPVVATDVGDLKNIIIPGETGYVVDSNTPRQLAEKMALLLAGTGANNHSAASIRKSVRRFGWDQIGEAIIAECRRVMADYPLPVGSIAVS